MLRVTKTDSLQSSRFSWLTEDRSVDDIRIRESDLDGMFLVGDVADLDWQLFVREQDVAVRVQNRLQNKNRIYFRNLWNKSYWFRTT